VTTSLPEVKGREAPKVPDTVEFSEEAKVMLEDFSPGGQEYLVRILKGSVSANAPQPHVHAGGMCLLVEVGRDGTIWVKKMSPFCLKPT
jgi:hypothetical protein